MNSFSSGTDLDEMQRLSIAGTLWRQNTKVRVRMSLQLAAFNDVHLQEWVRATHQLFPAGLFDQELRQWTDAVDNG